MEHAFLEPRAAGPRLRFCAPLLAVEGAHNLGFSQPPPTGLAAKSAWTSRPSRAPTSGEKQGDPGVEGGAPRAEQWMHRHQGPPQDKGQGCPSSPLPSSQTKVWTRLLVLRGEHRKLYFDDGIASPRTVFTRANFTAHTPHGLAGPGLWGPRLSGRRLAAPFLRCFLEPDFLGCQ